MKHKDYGIDLRKKYQPQWKFRTEREAKEELSFQKKYNPSTYKWLMTKDIKIKGKRIPAKQIRGTIKGKRKLKRQPSIYPKYLFGSPPKKWDYKFGEIFG